MKRRWIRPGLLGLIAAELVVAALVLAWVFGDESPAPAANRAETTAVRIRSIAAAESLPPDVMGALQAWTDGQPGDWTWAEPGPAGVERADLKIGDLQIGWQKRWGAWPLAQVVLVPVVPFPSLREEVAAAALQRAWLGRPRDGDEPLRLLVASDAAAALEGLFGPMGAGAAVQIVPAGELAGRLWQAPGALGLVPFERLAPDLRALSVDGHSALDRDFDAAGYALLARIWGRGRDRDLEDLAAAIEAAGAHTNRHPERMTILIVTGVTALTRGVAIQMEARGDGAWPARQVAGLLADADLTHVSNEVSFLADCAIEPGMEAFCARPAYLETLRLAGVDLVELTGNHNLDRGPGPALYSLDLYAEAGMHTFGGGRTPAEARQPLLLTHNGNRLAFLGYNRFGPDYAWASETRPGAARFSRPAMQADLARVRDQADLVFVHVQYTETYSVEPLPGQVDDFRAAVDAGADVVTGSQAHQPQAIEFYRGRPIFYGLGNLFFDQTWSAATRQGLVVRHVIYDGRLLSSQLIPTVMDGACQPWVAEPAERQAILEAVFAASGW
ncbi:MAG: CapA family protein [Anaerolineae bacterium]|jgi:poly-gamma-glutamate synthesis protein (capsule biosynthesis protein)